MEVSGAPRSTRKPRPSVDGDVVQQLHETDQSVDNSWDEIAEGCYRESQGGDYRHQVA
jgi:hypothetical protein